MCFVTNPNYGKVKNGAIRYKIVARKTQWDKKDLESYCDWLCHPILKYKVGQITESPTLVGIFVCKTAADCERFAFKYMWSRYEKFIIKLECSGFIAGGEDENHPITVETWKRVKVLSQERAK